MGYLNVTTGLKSGTDIPLGAGAMVIGRQSNCEILLPDHTVSRQHARIVLRDDGYYLEDMKSRNGTYLNGRRIIDPTRLNDRDQIQLYDVTLTFREQAQSKKTKLTPGSGRITPEPWSAEELDNRIEGVMSTETVAEMDVTFDEGRTQDNTEIRLQLILEITRCLDNPFERERMLSRLLDRLMLIFPQLEHGYILLANDSGTQLRPVAIHHADTEYNQQMTIRPVTRSIARQVLNEGKAVLSVDRVGPEDQINVMDHEIRSIMCAPLIGASRKALGIIYIDSAEAQKRFTPEDLNILTCVAILAGQALEQESMHSARYRAVVDTAVDGIITFSNDGRIESVNPAVEKLFGYRRAEIVGEFVTKLIPGATPKLFTSAKANSSDGATAGRELLAQKRDGVRFPIHLSIGAFELGGTKHFTGILHDITDKKRAENALQAMNENLELQVRDRTRSIRLLQDVAMIANESETVSDAIQESLIRICRYMNWNIGHAYLPSPDDPSVFVDSGIWSHSVKTDIELLKQISTQSVFSAGEGLVGTVIGTRKPHWLEDPTEDSVFTRAVELTGNKQNFVLAFPVLLGEQVVAVLEFFATEAREPDAHLLELMANIGTQLSRVVERRRLQEELIDAVWEQQRYFGQELHDTLGQELTGIGMMVNSVVRKLQLENSPTAGTILEVASMIQEAKTGVRRLAKGLFPVEVDAEGLRAALGDLARMTTERCSIDCQFESNGTMDSLDNIVATHLFRIAQEAVNNAVKHSQASRIDIRLQASNASMELSVEDNGIGVDLNQKNSFSGMGLRIMRYRANLIGADFQVVGTPGQGTRVSCLTMAPFTTVSHEESHANN